jgi:hypothetical protein
MMRQVIIYTWGLDTAVACWTWISKLSGKDELTPVHMECGGIVPLIITSALDANGQLCALATVPLETETLSTH